MSTIKEKLTGMMIKIYIYGQACNINTYKELIIMSYNKYAAKNLTPGIEFNMLDSLKTKDIVTAFVDGSFQDKENNGYGVLLKHKDVILHQESYPVARVDAELCNMTNVKAELTASLRAIQIALEKGLREITIVYDCEAIVDMLVCENIKSEFSLQYRRLLEEYSKNIKINFKKKNKEPEHKIAHNLARAVYM